MSEKFPAPYTSTTLMCLMASVECGGIGFAVEHNFSSWSLRDDTRLVASLYAVNSSLLSSSSMTRPRTNSACF